jgi:ABC-type bacteriocin/lantibiotic exporter with double-glycine peptidase domain
MPLWSFFCAVAVAAQGPYNEEFSTSATWTCGHTALYILIRLEGHECEMEDINGALDAKKGIPSMNDLKVAARRLGIRLRATHLQKRDWPVARPCIALVQEPVNSVGHFLVIRPIGHGKSYVQILDPPNPVTVIPAELVFADEDAGIIALVQQRRGLGVWMAGGCLLAGILLLALCAAQYFRWPWCPGPGAP